MGIDISSCMIELARCCYFYLDLCVADVICDWLFEGLFDWIILSDVVGYFDDV